VRGSLEQHTTNEDLTFGVAWVNAKEGIHRVLVNISLNDWAVHFIAPDGQTRIGPWLLHDSHKEVLKILPW
jgi:hypothetical protein